MVPVYLFGLCKELYGPRMLWAMEDDNKLQIHELWISPLKWATCGQKVNQYLMVVVVCSL